MRVNQKVEYIVATSGFCKSRVKNKVLHTLQVHDSHASFLESSSLMELLLLPPDWTYKMSGPHFPVKLGCRVWRRGGLGGRCGRSLVTGQKECHSQLCGVGKTLTFMLKFMYCFISTSTYVSAKERYNYTNTQVC